MGERKQEGIIIMPMEAGEEVSEEGRKGHLSF